MTLGVAEEPITARESAIQRHIMNGQGAPRFSPCSGTFVPPPLFMDVATVDEPSDEPGN